MNSVAALEKFIDKVVKPPRSKRFQELITSSKGQKKFLYELSHGIEDHIRDDVQTEEGFSSFRILPCYVYAGNVGFGIPKASVEEAYELLSVDDSWLIVTQAGSFAIYRPEFPWDAEISVVL